MKSFYPNLFNEESVASLMLDMIARKAPLLMRAGGGSLMQEGRRNPVCRTPITDEQRQEIMRLAREGKNGTEIGRIMGIRQSSVCRALARVGVQAVDGRKRRANA